MTKEQSEYFALCPRPGCECALEAEKGHDMSEGLRAHCPVHGAIFVDKKPPMVVPPCTL